MKKYFYYLLLMLPFTFAAVSCDDNDEDKIPDVSLKATISGGVFQDGEIYVTKGDALVVDAVTLVNNTGKEGALGAVSYYWDHYLIGTNITQPFELKFDTTDQPVGRHLLQAQMPIYVVDYPICVGNLQYYVNIVEPDGDLPEGDGDTSKTFTGIVTAKE